MERDWLKKKKREAVDSVAERTVRKALRSSSWDNVWSRAVWESSGVGFSEQDSSVQNTVRDQIWSGLKCSSDLEAKPGMR